MHKIYLSLCAYHHFKPHLEKFKPYIFRRDASHNCKYLRTLGCTLFFFFTGCMFKFSKI